VGNVKETIAADSMVTVLTAYQDGKAENAKTQYTHRKYRDKIDMPYTYT
jgi:hypothetical protein